MSLLKQSELQEFLEGVFHERGILRKGNNLQVFCPFCHHRKRKLEVCLDAPYFYNCWTCSVRGRGFFSLLKKLNASRDMFTRLEALVGKTVSTKDFDFEKPLVNFGPEPKEKVDVLRLPESFRSLLIAEKTAEYRTALAYAKRRKLTADDIIKYNIGYCSSGIYGRRIIFPSYDKDNNLNFFSGRSYYEDSYLKYKNSEFSKDIIGFENLVDLDYPVYLCEGALDAISIRRNAIPLFGKTLSSSLKIALTKSKCPEINIVLDDDALGGAINIANWVISIGKAARLVSLKGKDPNVLGFEKSMQQIKETKILDFTHLMMLKLDVK